MKTVTTPKLNSVQSIAPLWTPLPEDQQALLSGGAPKVTITSLVNVAGIAGSISSSAIAKN